MFDVVVTQPAFRSEYVRLKEKYGKHWVSRWPEQTDPAKYVFEEIAIAAWLLALWKSESPGDQERAVQFVDLGCGNGFLTYLLIEEGHSGWGIDRQRRGIWDEYPAAVRVRTLDLRIHKQPCSDESKVFEYLEMQILSIQLTAAGWLANCSQRSLLCADIEFSTSCVDTLADQFEGVQWVLGNHTDELTPWVPLITRQLAIRQLQKYTKAQQDQLCVNTLVATDDSEGTVQDRANTAVRNAGVDIALLHKTGGGSLQRSAGNSCTKSLPQVLPRYWVLPCCLWDIGPHGLPSKFIGHDTSLGRYHTYAQS